MRLNLQQVTIFDLDVYRLDILKHDFFGALLFLINLFVMLLLKLIVEAKNLFDRLFGQIYLS